MDIWHFDPEIMHPIFFNPQSLLKSMQGCEFKAGKTANDILQVITIIVQRICCHEFVFKTIY